MAIQLKSASKYLKYLPGAAVVYAAYQEYADRGLDGIMADLQSITVEGIKAKWQNIVFGAGAFVVGDIGARGTSNSYAKIAIKTLAYYVGTKQLLGALRSGAGVGGGSVVPRSQTVMTGARGRGGITL